MKSFLISLILVVAGQMAFGQQVKWYTIEEAFKLNESEPRKIMIDVYTDWCGWCKVMDKQTFSHPVIAEYLNSNYYAVKLNAEQKEDITLMGDTFKYIAQGTRGYHELAAVLLNGKMSYPSVVFLANIDGQLKAIHHQPGFVKPGPFDQMLKFIGGDHYLSEDYNAWLSTYESKIEE